MKGFQYKVKKNVKLNLQRKLIYRVATATEILNSRTSLGHFPGLFKAISTYVML